MSKMRKGWALGRAEVVWLGVLGAGAAAVWASLPVPSTIADFFGPGTQPMTIMDPIADSQSCAGCHAFIDPVSEPYRPWRASMMGQAARDPLFYACLAIAEQDAAFAGDFCIRCHVPGGWLEGRSTPTDGSALTGKDFDGVSCNFCHRVVNPEYVEGESPSVDEDIINALMTVPPNPHTAYYVVDPLDRRRGPLDLGPDFFYHDWLQSPLHSDSQMCATCHDVSNPMYSKRMDGTYGVIPGTNGLGMPHPTGDKADMFPIERTYSEWSMSAFAAGPIDMTGRFGGNDPMVSSCQDCHMPKTEGRACGFGDVRPDLPQHHFNGGNTWVLRAIRNLYPDSETKLDASLVDDSINRALEMLANASDMELSHDGADLNVRVVNMSGHKLPTGYPEGRRMWVNVKFLDETQSIVQEHGAYDPVTADLTTGDTKVYEAKMGIGPDVAALTGLPQGESFHFALNNMFTKDNRIPPMGFTNANFDAIQALPVNYSYADGQHWDDTQYTIPAGARLAEVSVFFQTTSKEYIEFLRDANTTNSAGQTAYDQWVATGKSEPALMDTGVISFCPADMTTTGAGMGSPEDGLPDGVTNLSDLLFFVNVWQSDLGMTPGSVADVTTTGSSMGSPDFGQPDGSVDLSDLLYYVNQWQTGLAVCP